METKTNFSIETMVDFGVYSGKRFSEKTYKTYNIVGEYFTGLNNRRKWSEILIKNSKYYNDNLDERRVYIYIDINKSEISKVVNKNQLENDNKLNKYQQKMEEQSNEISQLNNNIKLLKTNNTKLDNENKIINNSIIIKNKI